MNNSRGMITVDFLFAIVLILGFASLLFVLMFTLSVASVTQYITFAAARNYVVAHIDQASQEKRAVAKYKELISNSVFKPLYANGWYQIDAEPNVGDHVKIIPGYGGARTGGKVNEFWGVGTRFVAKVLDFHVPFFGATAPDSDGTGSGFKTYMGSYLGREPSADECIKFTAARWTAIRNLEVSGGSSYSTGTSDQGYYPMTDDGC
jgi:hypothetical protein